MKPKLVNPDRPINTPDEDLLERGGFVNRLADCLVLEEGEPSIVVGLEGRWGDGKTSCINMIRKVLERHSQKPIVIEYTPWLVSQIDSLIEGFFLQLASAVGHSNRGVVAGRVAVNIIDFAKLLTPIKLIPGAEPWGSIIEKTLKSVGCAAEGYANMSNISLSEKKQQLEESLKDIKSPIVVIIDDTDRMSPEDVRVVFQMLKAIADFPRISYLVAYDPVTVEKALTFGSEYDGRYYLDKIIQVSVTIPRLSIYHRKRILRNTINVVVARCGASVAPWEMQLLDSLIRDHNVCKLVDTPRTIARLENRLHFCIHYALDEVCLADIVLFELLSIRFPRVREWVSENIEDITRDSKKNTEFREAPESILKSIGFSRDPEAARNSLTKRLNDDISITGDEVLACLGRLFPVLSNHSTGTYSIGERRICYANQLLKVLHSDVVSFIPSSRETMSFLEHPEKRHILFDAWRANRTIREYLSLIEDELPKVEHIDRQLLITDLLRGAGLCQRADYDWDYTMDFVYVIRSIVDSCSDMDEKLCCLSVTMKSVEALSISISILADLLRAHGVYNNGVYNVDGYNEAQNISVKLNQSDLVGLVEEWIGSVSKEAGEESLFENHWNALRLMWAWVQLSPNGMTEVVDNFNRMTPNTLLIDRLMKSLSPEGLPPGFIPDSIIESIRERASEGNSYANELIRSWDSMRQRNGGIQEHSEESSAT